MRPPGLSECLRSAWKHFMEHFRAKNTFDQVMELQWNMENVKCYSVMYKCYNNLFHQVSTIFRAWQLFSQILDQLTENEERNVFLKKNKQKNELPLLNHFTTPKISLCSYQRSKTLELNHLVVYYENNCNYCHNRICLRMGGVRKTLLIWDSIKTKVSLILYIVRLNRP